MEIRDPIHGFINPTDTEIKIIDTPIVQRLRRIKQLAMAYLVYPGANHTRFDHSLGVMYVAKELSKKLLPSQEDEDKRRIIGYAALLHDIGHGPFSHTSEYILDRYYDNKSNPTEKIHEKITAKLVDINSSLIKLISEAERKQIIQIIEGKSPGISIIKEIVSGPLDADKLDYLLRDVIFAE
jgi:HD superfamily phosphohydrolase